MKQFWSFLLSGLLLVVLSSLGMGCGLNRLVQMATPTSTATPIPTPTFTPLPTPTISPTPSPAWQATGYYLPEKGREFYNGQLSSDGQFMVLVSQPVQPEDATRMVNFDPVIYVVKTSDMSLVWKGRLQTQGRIDWVSQILWIPDTPYIALVGQTESTTRIVLIRSTDGKVLWEKASFYEYPAAHYVSYDPFQKVLLVREGNQIGLQAYQVPEMKPVGQYMPEEKRQGCCLVHALAWNAQGVAAIGWERYGSQRYHLIVWEGGNSQGRTMRLPYNRADTAFDYLVWGPRDEVAVMLIPATASSSDVYTIVFMDAQTGNVRWTVTAREYPVTGLAWLNGRGWLLGSGGEVRLYSQPMDKYEVLRKQDGRFLMSLSADASGTKWLTVLHTRAELWEWK